MMKNDNFKFVFFGYVPASHCQINAKFGGRKQITPVAVLVLETGSAMLPSITAL